MQKELLVRQEKLADIGLATRLSDGPLLGQALSLMQSERISAGGNIRDKTEADIISLVSAGGQLWGWVENGIVLSVCTLEMKSGDRAWWYINNGVTHPDHRGRGLSSKLVESAVQLNEREGVGFIALYIRNNLFERLGFREITVLELASIDDKISGIVRGKLRPKKETHILIKAPK